MFERDKDELRELGIPLVTEDIGGVVGRRGRLPDRPARVRPARHRVRARRARRARPGQPHLGARLAGRSRPPRRCASSRRPASSATATPSSASSRGWAPASRPSSRSRTPSSASAPSASATAPAARARSTRATRPAVGARLVARPLVPHRLRPRPRGAPGLPPVAHRRRRPPRSGRPDAVSPCPPTTAPSEMIRTTVGEQTAQHRDAAGPRGARAVPASPCHRATEAADGWSVDRARVPSPTPTSFADEVSGYGAGRRRARRRRRSATPWSAGSRAPPPHIRGCRMTPPDGQAPSVPETATDRLSRLLTMVPWLVEPAGDRPRRRPPPTSASPSSSSRPTCGCSSCAATARCPTSSSTRSGRAAASSSPTPTPSPAPCGSGVDEALTLMVGLRALAAVPGWGSATPSSGPGQARGGHRRQRRGRGRAVEVAIDEGVEAELLADARRARRGSGAGCTCATSCPSRDEATERDVDPMRVVNLDARWYLEGWCHRAQDTRLFRMDRIERLEVLDVDGTPPPQAAAARPRRRHLHRRAPTTRSSPCGCARSHLGEPTTTRWSRSRTARRRLADGLAAHGRHRLAAPPAVAARGPGHAARAEVPRRGGAPTARARPSRHTRGRRPRPLRRGRVVARVVVGADLGAARRDRGGLPRARACGACGARSRSSPPSSSGPPRRSRPSRPRSTGSVSAPPRRRSPCSRTRATCAASARPPGRPCESSARARRSQRLPGWARDVD